MDTQQQTRTGIVVLSQRQAAQSDPLEGPAASVVAAPSGWGEQSWRVVLRVALSRAALTAVASLLVWAALPMVLGWTPRVIMSGSMEPLVQTGDVVVTRTVDTAGLEQGDVITTVDPDTAGKTRTHRYVQRDADGLIVTKGDANREQDSTPVADADVLGQGVLRVPFVGKPAYWVAARDHVALGLSFVVLGGLVLAASGPRRRPTDGPTRGGGTTGPGGPHRSERRVRARGRRGRGVGAAVTLTMTAALVVTTVPGSYAAFSAGAANPGSTLAAAASFTPYRDAVLADSPLLYWRLDETAGTAAADSANSDDPGTVRNGVTWGVSGALASEVRSTALNLTNNGFVTENSNTTHAGNPSTSEIWVRTSSTSGGPLLTFGQSGGTTANSSTTTDRVLYLSPDGKVRFGVRGVVIASNAALNDGAWHHVAATYTNTSGGMKLYVDGVQQTATGTAAPRFTSAGFWRVGGEVLAGWPSAPTGNYLAGTVDEVAVYAGVALSATRIQSHHNVGRTS